jgi:hypothetical protein
MQEKLNPDSHCPIENFLFGRAVGSHNSQIPRPDSTSPVRRDTSGGWERTNSWGFHGDVTGQILDTQHNN